MKTKLYSIAAALFLLLTATISRAQVIVVQHGSSGSVYSNIDSAVLAASAGDYLYLSGGLFIVHGVNGSGNDSIHFYKLLHFVGAGCNPDSAFVTGITEIQGAFTASNFGAILVGSAADGSTFDGIYFNAQSVSFGNGGNQPDSFGHFIFNRCRFGSVICSSLGGGPNAANLNLEFHECVMQNLSEAGQGNCTATIDRCVVTGQCQALSSAVTWTNCVMGEPVDHGTINNCIIYAGSNSFVNQFGAIFNNCILANTAPSAGGSDVFNNCSFGADVPGQFVNVPTQTFTWANDYHLVNNSIAHNYGTDGHDDGIYGSSTPAKAGYVPYNPHYTGVTIPAATDANGNLNINIHVSAQTY